MEDIFGAAKMSSIYLVCLKIPDIFWGERFMLGPSLRMKKMRVPPPPPPIPWDLSISSNLSLLNAYKWAFVLVGFCSSGLLS